MDKNDTTSTSNGQAPNGTDPQAQAATSETQAVNETSNQSTDELLRQIKELRAENATHRRKTKEQEDTARIAMDQQLKEQGEYKKLADQYQARTQELEPVAERYTALSGLIAEQVKAQIKDWPAEVKAFDPGEDAPIEQRLAWLEKSKPLIEKLQQQARAQQPGNAPNPRPAQQPVDQARTLEQQLRASGKYGAR